MVMELKIGNAKDCEISQIVSLVAEINSNPKSRCLQVDVEQESILAEFKELDAPLSEVFLVARQGQEIVGALGLDLDREGECVWLLGPFSHTSTINEALLSAAYKSLPDWVKKLRQYFDERSVKLIELHENHWFRTTSLNYQYKAQAADFTASLDEATSFIEGKEEEAFRKLHELHFPQTWLSASAILERNGKDIAVFVTKEKEELSGYVCASIHPTNIEGTVEYVAVKESFRSKGLGGKLMNRALYWLFIERKVKSVQLVVEAQKKGAHRLYERCGFNLDTVGIAMSLDKEVARALETEWHVHSVGGKKIQSQGIRLAADCPWSCQGASHFVLALSDDQIEQRVQSLAPCNHKFSVNVLVDEPVKGRNDICYMVHHLDEIDFPAPKLKLVPALDEGHFAKLKALRREIEKSYPNYTYGAENEMVEHIAYKQKFLEGAWYLAEVEGEAVGAAGLIVVETSFGVVGRLQDVDITPKRQSQGLGNELLQALLQKARDLELKALCLRAEYDDWPRSWYSRHGFHEVAYCRRFSLTRSI